MSRNLAAILQTLRQGYLVWPLLLALGGVALAFLVRWIDESDAVRNVQGGGFGALAVGPDAALDVLSVVATGAVTVLSLVHSMTLVVFTLAASALGNRIIRTFGDNPLGQVTAGTLAATFLFALTALYLAPADRAPLVSTALAVVLALVSVLLLIAFVNDVAHRIQIDNELARIQRMLAASVARMVKGAGRSAEPRRIPDRRTHAVTLDIPATTSGYITAIHSQPLVAVMKEVDGWLILRVAPGDFVLEGETLATAYLSEAPGARSALEGAVQREVTLGDARAPGNDVLFSVHLMVEIALRALSPGVNDAYTAVAAIDQLSAALAGLIDRSDLTVRLASADGTVRVITQPLSVRAVVGAALHPIRRAAGGNVLVMLALARALARLARRAGADHGALLRKHIRLTVAEGRQDIVEVEDRAALGEALWEAWRETRRLPG